MVLYYRGLFASPFLKHFFFKLYSTLSHLSLHKCFIGGQLESFLEAHGL